MFKIESENIWEIAKFALNIVSENYKEEPWDCIIDNDERAIYEILNKYTKDKDEQNKKSMVYFYIVSILIATKIFMVMFLE